LIVSPLETCLDAANNFLLSKDEARAICVNLATTIEQHWDAVCDEAQLSEVDRNLLWRRQFLNPFAFQQGHASRGMFRSRTPNKTLQPELHAMDAMNPTIIRPAAADDRNSALAIAAAGMREFGVEPEFDTLDADLALIGTAHARLVAGLVAERDGMVCGCIVVTRSGDDGSGKLSGFYVDPASRGHGIGRALLRAALQAARAAGLLQLTLLTWEHMHAARALYEASGWVRIDDPPAHSGANRAYRLVLAAPARIRVFAPGDESAVIRLWQDCGLTRPWNDPHRDIARKLGEQPELFLVACRDEAIVGTAMAGFDGHRGWVHYLAVAPAEQGSGLGRALMEQIESLLQARGCPKINLQVRGSNSGVLAFYERLGYVAEDVVCLGKRLIAD